MPRITSHRMMDKDYVAYSANEYSTPIYSFDNTLTSWPCRPQARSAETRLGRSHCEPYAGITELNLFYPQKEFASARDMWACHASTSFFSFERWFSYFCDLWKNVTVSFHRSSASNVRNRFASFAVYRHPLLRRAQCSLRPSVDRALFLGPQSTRERRRRGNIACPAN